MGRDGEKNKPMREPSSLGRRHECVHPTLQLSDEDFSAGKRFPCCANLAYLQNGWNNCESERRNTVSVYDSNPISDDTFQGKRRGSQNDCPRCHERRPES